MSVVNQPVRILKEDGVNGLLAGVGPTVVRTMALNMGVVASIGAAEGGGCVE